MRSLFVGLVLFSVGSLSAFVSLGCSSTATGSEKSQGGGGANDSGASTGTSPEQACKDTADAAAKTSQRCDGALTYQQYYDEFLQAAAQGSCANIVKIRDEAALRKECIPSFATISCTDFAAGVVAPGCRGQLLRAAGYRIQPVPASRAATAMSQGL